MAQVVIVPESGVISGTDAEKQEKLYNRELNENAYADLILSIDASNGTSRTVFNLVKNSKSTEYPDGHAGLAWESLEKKFEPKTAPSKAKLHSMFYSAKMNMKADPMNYITYLEDVRTRLEDAGSKMTDENFILQVLNTVTKNYITEVRLIEERLDRNEEVSIDDVKDTFALEYERSTKWKHEIEDDSDEEDEEKAFIASNYKGRCNYCCKYGHKAYQCNQRKKDGANNKNQKNKRS